MSLPPTNDVVLAYARNLEKLNAARSLFMDWREQTLRWTARELRSGIATHDLRVLEPPVPLPVAANRWVGCPF